MYTNIIVACDFNKVIGDGLKIPWSIRDDMKFFRKTTMNCNVIMGRKTFESLDCQALDGRNNIVITSKALKYREEKLNGKYDDFIFEDNIESSLTSCIPDVDTFVIGGAEIYKAFLERDYVKKCFISLVKRTFFGDVLFPNLGPDWVIDSLTDYEDFTLLEMRRII